MIQRLASGFMRSVPPGLSHRLLLGCFAVVCMATLLGQPRRVRAAGGDVWIPATSTSVARERPTATLLPNSKVLLVGGDNSLTNYLRSVELYDPLVDAWSAAAPLATGRSFHTATLLPNGAVLVVGGFGGAPGVNLASAELYNPATDTWSSASQLHTARRAHTATLLQIGRAHV